MKIKLQIVLPFVTFYSFPVAWFRLSTVGKAMDRSIDTAMTLESDGAVMRTVYIMAKEDDLMMITTSTFGRPCCNIDNSVIAGSKHIEIGLA